ncbi:hypothetical protein COLO4_06868 [Corchorus olitorius]|uniref:Uncharacterized protein n=1 Tax=Corchorus olitorius TaxID=93759 RepID=A0A1R3KLR8_9ROSI|nr:hypothetical protein COLO4_06868 [Corchorus olitorius]
MSHRKLPRRSTDYSPPGDDGCCRVVLFCLLHFASSKSDFRAKKW